MYTATIISPVVITIRIHPHVFIVIITIIIITIAIVTTSVAGRRGSCSYGRRSREQ